MYVIYSRNEFSWKRRNWISLLIRVWTNGPWSHCGALDGDDVIEAVGAKPIDMLLILLGLKENSISLGGVVRTPLADFKKRYTHWEIREMAGDTNKAVELIGTPFDVHGFFGSGFGINIEKPHWNFCCEVVTVCLAFFNKEEGHKVNPNKLVIFSRSINKGSK